MSSLLLLLALTLDARASTVVLDGARYFELVGPDQPKDTTAPPAPWAAERTVVLTPEAHGTRIHATWRVAAPQAGWLDDLIAGPTVRVEGVTIDGRPAAITSGATGTRVTARVERDATVVLDGFVDGDPRVGQSFALLPAVRGTIAAQGTPLDLHVEDGARAAILAPEGLLASARDLAIVLSDPAPLAEKPPLFVADVAQGLTVRDGDVEGHAEVRWLVRQGELGDALPLVVRGAGHDVTVTGENVRAYRWSGDTLIIEPARPVRDALTVSLAWSVPVSAGDTASVPVPEIAPTGAFRVDTSVLVARDDAIEVVPELPTYAPVPTTSLPPEAAGLVTGTPTAAFRGQGAGSLSILRVVPIEQPAAIVDMASLTIATNDEGRVLIRGYYTVRNERSAALRVVPPPGVQILGVQVSGKPVTLGKDDQPGLLVPLPRSLETVDGLLSFPVEVIAFGTGDGWTKREERTVPLLAVDAPVAVQRVTLHLPPGYELRNKPGEDDVVDGFTEGETLSYGLAVGDVAAAEVDARFQEALDAWMENDFETAQTKLDELRSMGGESENVRKLQSNLDVVDVDDEVGKAEAEEDTTVARRVKDMARARAQEDVARREELITEAKEAERSGDYERASASYSSAYEIGEKLSGLEQTESASFRGSNASVGQELVEVQKKAESKAKQKPADAKVPSTKTLKLDEQPVEVTADKVVLDFDGLEIDGELVKPEGNLMLTPDVPRAGDDGRVPLVQLGYGDGDAPAQLAAAATGVALPPPPPADPGVDFLAENPSFATGVFDNETVGVGGLGLSGSGEGGGGVGYGYGYGSLGGVEGGVMGGTVAGVPVGRDYQTESVVVTSRRGGVHLGGGGGGVGRGPRGGKGAGVGYGSAAPETPPPLPMLAIGADEPDEPVVTAQSLSLVIPDLGETVLFQTLLLPEGAAPAVLVKAKRSTKANPSE